MRRQIRRRHFAAQQHLVADDDGADHVRDIRLASATAASICSRFFSRLAARARCPACTFRPSLGGDRRRPDRARGRSNRCGRSRSCLASWARSSSICAARNAASRIERGLRAAERRIGDAIELLAGADRRTRQRQPAGAIQPPDAGNDAQAKHKEREGRAKRGQAVRLRRPASIAVNRRTAKPAECAADGSMPRLSRRTLDNSVARPACVDCWTSAWKLRHLNRPTRRSGCAALRDRFARHQAGQSRRQ